MLLSISCRAGGRAVLGKVKLVYSCHYVKEKRERERWIRGHSNPFYPPLWLNICHKHKSIIFKARTDCGDDPAKVPHFTSEETETQQSFQQSCGWLLAEFRIHHASYSTLIWFPCILSRVIRVHSRLPGTSQEARAEESPSLPSRDFWAGENYRPVSWSTSDALAIMH